MSRTTKSHSLCVLFCLLSWTFLLAGGTWALDFTWNSQSGGSFQSATNWTPPFIGPPDDASDTAIFALGGTFTTSFADDVTIGQLAMRAASGIVTLDLNGHTCTLSGPAAGSLFVGQSAGNVARLVLTDGTVEADDVITIGVLAGSQGQLSVASGATLSQTAGHLHLGESGTGSMQVSQGAVANLGSVSVGHVPSGNGTLNVSGPNSRLLTGPLVVGNSGTGNLLISQAGRVEATQIDLGISGGGNGTITVNGADSLLRTTSVLDLADGPNTQAQLTVLAGGHVDIHARVRIAAGTSGTGTVVVDGTNSLVEQSGADTLTIGSPSGSLGRLTIQNGGHYRTSTGLTVVNATGQISMPVGASSRLLVNGDLRVVGGLIERTNGAIEHAPHTRIDVLNGGRISGVDSFFDGNTINIQGMGSTVSDGFWFLDNNSDLNVAAGGTFDALLALVDGTAVVDGAGSFARADRIGGNTGTASLTVSHAAALESQKLSVPLAFLMGDAPHGNVSVETQGQMRIGVLEVGANLFEGGSGLIQVNGTASSLLLDDALPQTGLARATIGSSTFGTGTVIVSDGGLFQTGTGTVTVNRTGQVNIAGGTFAIRGPMRIDGGQFTLASGAITQQDGVMFHVENGGLVDFAGNYTLPTNGIVSISGATSRFEAASILMANSANQIQISDGGTLAADTLTLNFGTLSGDGTVAGNVTNSSIIAPGASAGHLDFTGNLSHQSAGVLQIELGGTNAGQFDSLRVQGQLELVGSLAVSTLGGFVPSHADEFLIVDLVGTRSGVFSGLPEGASVAEFGFNRMRITYLGGDGNDIALKTLSIADFDRNGLLNCGDVDALVAELAAGGSNLTFDMNNDGALNQDDLTRWLQAAGNVNLPTGNPYLPGDANLDGFVDGSDFIVWNSHKFTNAAAWCSGDFNADGVVDGADFITWNAHKFTSSDAVSAVPEPVTLGLLACGLFSMLWHRYPRTAV